MAREPAGAPRPAERRVCDDRNAALEAALDDSAAESAVVEDAERDLDSRDRRELERLVELHAIDVRETDPPHEALVDEPGECAHGGSPRRPRVRRVDEVEIDLEPVER